MDTVWDAMSWKERLLSALPASTEWLVSSVKDLTKVAQVDELIV
jgi:hypothetical protein